ncbi:MAG: thiamine phosphate synthase [Nitrospirales bacterium]|nr:MAG: thiamine phosphate synthase [Nitrospirales bacterium]
MSTTSLPRLYLLTDRHNTSQRPISSIISQAVEAGVRMVQIREKDLDTRPLIELVQHLMPLIKRHQGKVFVNDRIDLAMALDADGVHRRSDSLPLPLARRLLGQEKLIGISTHSVEEVRKAESEGADFIVLGPIFETSSKRMYGPPLGLHTLETACRTSRLPIFAIGGLNPTHVPSVLASGAYGVAVISAILQAPSIVDRTHEFLSQLP